MKNKKVPMRMCIGCKNIKPKKELIRVVKSKENEISVDFTGRKNGRGAYICNDIACLENAKKTKRFEKTFEIALSSEVYDLLRQQMGDSDEL